MPPLTPLSFRGPCAAGISAAPWRPASSPGLVAPPSALPVRQPEPDEGRQDGLAPLSARRLLRERTVLLHPAKAGRQSAAWIAGRGALRPRPRPLPPGTRPSPPSAQPRLPPGSTRPPPRTPPHPRPRVCRTPRRSRRERRCVATCARDILQQPSKARLKSCHRDSELIAENSNKISLCVFQLLPGSPSSRADPDVSSKAPGESPPAELTAHSSREHPRTPTPSAFGKERNVGFQMVLRQLLFGVIFLIKICTEINYS